MKTKEEIEQLTEKLYPISPNPNQMIEGFERVAYKKGYLQCQEDMVDKKYTEEDMRECWRACLNFNKPAGLDSGINYSDFINSLNKQDK
jgi:hypothetical protein